jgi:hypothetical protein
VSGLPQIVRRSNASISAEQARDTRAGTWAFVLRCWQEKRKAAEPPSKPDGRDDCERLANKERRPA